MPTRFGLFLSPLHAIGADPTLVIHEDLNLAVLAEELGFDEFWVGEHHSGGWGLISSPELFIAAAAERTKRIKFGSGVVSVPYHHPFMVAERAALLSHLTRGRFILGLGAGSAASDMHMLNIDPAVTRDRLAEGGKVIARLLNGDRVSAETDWFSLQDAQLQLSPFQHNIEMVIASAATPHGPTLAGSIGAHLLSHASTPWGNVRPGKEMGIIGRLPSQWDAYSLSSTAFGLLADRGSWRVNLPVHVAESRSEALEEIYDGWLAMRHELWRDTMGIPMSRAAAGDRPAFDATLRESGMIVGSPEEVAAQIVDIERATGGFGSLLITIQDWASAENVRKSVRLFATQVRPILTKTAESLRASQRWAADNRNRFQTGFSNARTSAMDGSSQ